MEHLFSMSNFWRICDGVATLLIVSLVSIVVSIFGGLIFGRAMIAKNVAIRIICKVILETVRIIPLIVWLFIVYYGISSAFDIHISGITSGIIVFSIWGIAEMGDLVRASINNVPKHSRESALALGFNSFQIETLIIIPQAIRMLIPSSINLFGRIIKTTSLLTLISVVELLKVGQQLIELFGKYDAIVSLCVYGIIFIIYFCLCYPFSYLGDYLEKKFHN